jgi:delta 1-pyrroline-5-carboxylate dehydrogenase
MASTAASNGLTKGGTPVLLIINGKDIISPSTFNIVNPGSSQPLWDALAASIIEATQAVEAAQAAFPSWSATKPSARREILFRAADLLHCREDELLYYQSQDCPATTKSPPDPGFHHQVFIRVVAWNQAIRSDFTS